MVADRVLPRETMLVLAQWSRHHEWNKVEVCIDMCVEMCLLQVMHELHLRLPQEKTQIAEHCNALWPCVGEISSSSYGAYALEDNLN